MIQAGIIGGAGYTAGELIRLLLHHPAAALNFVYSTSNAGNLLSDVHQDLQGDTDKRFTGEINPDVDVLFLCLGHGNSRSFLEKHTFSEKTSIIDLSNDFRLSPDADFGGMHFVYGLPELHKSEIENAQYIANPGCFATAVQLALLPLAQHGLLRQDVHITAVTGATGAGTSLSPTSHFPWRANNFSYYKPFAHQHLGEIEQSITGLQGSFRKKIRFMPYRGDFPRGIFATAYTAFDGDIGKAGELYKEFYKNAAFTHVSDKQLHLKQVVNTNKCLIHLHKHDDQLLVTSIIDNLTKGASGQAVHNMNLVFGLEETLGLGLKASYF